MTDYLSLFTQLQLHTFNRINTLEEEMKTCADPSTFVFNKRAFDIQTEIDKLQNECDHIYHDGVCVVCGKCEV